MTTHEEQNLRVQIEDLERRLGEEGDWSRALGESLAKERADHVRELESAQAAYREDLNAAKMNYEASLAEIERKAFAKLKREKEIKDLEDRLAALKREPV